MAPLSPPQLCAAAVLAALAVAVALAPLRHWLLRAAVLDRPNARSLHQQPIPRGGGLAIALVALLAHALFAPLALARGVPAGVLLAWGVAAAGFAVLGWLDDRRSRAVAGRLLVQCALAAGFVAVLAAHDALPAVPAAPLVVVLACVWSVNLFNFMDGADGLAGLQLALTASGALLVPGVAGAGAGAGVAAVLAGAALGFLAWNRPPARIFMGDTGSYFVGFELAALALLAPREGGLGAPWVVLFLPFVVDASLTLAGRVLQGQRFWNAHREHAYQRLLLAGWRAPRLLLALALVNLAVCWPLAWWAARGGGLPAAGAALLALGVLWWRARVAAARRRAG